MDLSGHEGEIPITCTHVAGGGGDAQIQTQIHPSYRIIRHDSPASPTPLSAATPLKVPVFVKYRECLKNQAVSIGRNATDGCGEFMPSGEEGTLEALNCSACSCHRNFHRKETKFTPFVYKPRASLGGAMASPLIKKRQRTKFTPNQKEMMLGFAEKLGWRLQSQEESVVQKFCQEIGVKRRVFKVWMHNNKHNFAKKSSDLQLDTSTDTLNDL